MSVASKQKLLREKVKIQPQRRMVATLDIVIKPWLADSIMDVEKDENI